MPKILFASNSISHFPGSFISGNTWAFDGARVPYAIGAPPLTNIGYSQFEESTTDSYWFHFKHGVDFFDINDLHPIIEVQDENGNRIFFLNYEERGGDGYRLYTVIDGQSYIDQRWLPAREDAMRTFDIEYSWDALNIYNRVYINEVLIVQHSRVRTNVLHPKAVLFAGTPFGNTYYSEIIIADGDTRNARLDLIRPVAVGAYDNWNGAVSTLSDDDPTTGMTTTLAEQSQSTILTPYGGADNISNIVQVTTSVRGINSPENLQHLIRMSGVDYLTPSFAVPFTKTYQITDWAINPATSLPWTAADLATAEFGFKSVA